MANVTEKPKTDNGGAATVGDKWVTQPKPTDNGGPQLCNTTETKKKSTYYFHTLNIQEACSSWE